MNFIIASVNGTASVLFVASFIAFLVFAVHGNSYYKPAFWVNELTRELSVIKLASIPPIDFSGLSEEERVKIFDWARGIGDNTVPLIIQEFINKCKSGIKT